MPVGGIRLRDGGGFRITMTTRLGKRGFLSGRPGRQIVAAAFVTALVVVAASVYVWIDLGGGAIYGEAHVKEAEFHPPDRLRLILDSCYAFIKQATTSWEPSLELKVEVMAFSTFPRYAGCQDYVDVQLRSSPEGRTVIDRHTGQKVNVRTVK